MFRKSSDIDFLKTGEVTIDADGIPVNLGYRGIGSPEGKIAAPVGSIYTDTAATNGAIRWVKTSGTGNTGWRVDYGDTGLRDLTASISGDAEWTTTAAGSGVFAQRVGNIVYLTVSAVINSSGSTQYVTLANLPVGMRPNKNQFGNTWRGVRTYLRTSGQLDFQGPSGSSDYWSYSWVTNDAWPTSLPGTPA